MSGNFLQSVSAGVLAYVVEPAVRSLVLAMIAGIVLAGLRVRNVRVGLAVWRGVLCAALVMPFLASLVPPLPFEVPVSHELREMLAERMTPGLAGAQSRQGGTPLQVAAGSMATADEIVRTEKHPADHVVGTRLRPSALRLESAPPAAKATALQSWLRRWRVRPSSAVSWGTVCVAVYLAVAFCLLLRFVVGLWRCRKLALTSTAIEDAHLHEAARLCAQELALASVPRIAESPRVSVPLTLGVAHPVILLPADWREWEQRKLHAVLAHELSHVARRDALTQRLALLHSALFWFSPLSWWLEHRLAELAEEASDEAALASGVDRANYAETLLGFFATLESAPGRVWWQGLSMASTSRVERRVDRILAWKGNISMHFRKSLLVAVAVLAAPGVLLIAAARPTRFTASFVSQSPTASPSADAGASPDAVITVRPAAQDGVAPEPAAPASPALPPTNLAPAPVPANPGPNAPVLAGVTAPSLPAAPPEPGPQGGVATVTTDKPTIVVESGGSHSERAYHFHGSGSCSYNGWSNAGLMVSIGDECMNSNSSSKDLPTVSAQIAADSVAFEHDGKTYVIQEAATVARARHLFDEMLALGEKQSELGRQQSALGDKQSALGEQMEQVRVQVPDLTAQLKEISAKMAELSANGGTVSQIGELQSQLGELQSRIGEVESRAGQQQGEIGRRQGELGRQQGELGRKQGELGRRESEAAEVAVRELKKLLDDAVSRSLAKPQVL